MSEYVLVWDLETIPDLACVARVNGLADGDDEGARAALGDEFPKLLFHKVACIGALVAERINGVWNVRSLGAPHMGERSEAELLQSFVDRIEAFRPQMVTFNGSSFDLPVLRYRAMINRVSAPGLDVVATGTATPMIASTSAMHWPPTARAERSDCMNCAALSDFPVSRTEWMAGR